VPKGGSHAFDIPALAKDRAFILLLLLLDACRPAPTPTPTPVISQLPPVLVARR